MAPTAKQKCALGGYGGSRRKALKGEKNGCTADQNYRGAKGWGKKETAFAAVRTALSAGLFGERVQAEVAAEVLTEREPGSEYVCRNCRNFVVQQALTWAQERVAAGTNDLGCNN
eukprot:COSAG01_NODE_7335_length_3246_cov_3.993963_6_plen_115_part_00